MKAYIVRATHCGKVYHLGTRRNGKYGKYKVVPWYLSGAGAPNVFSSRQAASQALNRRGKPFEQAKTEIVPVCICEEPYTEHAKAT